MNDRRMVRLTLFAALALVPAIVAAQTAERAIVATDDGVVVVAADGTVERAISAFVADWCYVDVVGSVVWLTGDRGEAAGLPVAETRGLYVVDLEGEEPSAQDVLDFPPDTSPPVTSIAYGGNERRLIEGHEFRVGLRITPGATPAVAPVRGCQDDMEWYCDDAAIATELAALVVQPLGATELLERAAARASAESRFHLPWEPSEPPTVEVLQAATRYCSDDWPSCPAVTTAPGTPYWSVMVDYDRGDFAHETWQLVTVDGRYVDPWTGTVSDDRIDGANSFADVQIAPSGAAFVWAGGLVSFERGEVLEGYGCGWLPGSYQTH